MLLPPPCSQAYIYTRRFSVYTGLIWKMCHKTSCEFKGSTLIQRVLTSCIGDYILFDLLPLKASNFFSRPVLLWWLNYGRWGERAYSMHWDMRNTHKTLVGKSEEKWLLMMIIMMMSMGWDYVPELRPPTGLVFIPRWCMSMENHGVVMMLTEENSWFVHQSSLAILPA
jgi:hypothetical protein